MIQETQREAYHSIENKEQKQELVFRAIKSYNGLTLFELVKILDWPVNRISGRISDLTKQGKIKDSGSHRVNPESGKSGIVWIASLS